MNRHDYAFPFRIDPVSHQAARTSYETHVDQMIRQVLLTSPGERADLPEFGCGLRRLLFRSEFRRDGSDHPDPGVAVAEQVAGGPNPGANR